MLSRSPYRVYVAIAAIFVLAASATILIDTMWPMRAPSTHEEMPVVIHVATSAHHDLPPTHTTATEAELPVTTVPTGTDPVSAVPKATGQTIPVSKGQEKTQYVLLAFDGSYSIQMWKDTRAFAKQMTDEGKSLHFTYFISGVYLMTPTAAKSYLPPHHATGTSAIGFAGSKTDVSNRIEQMNLAMQEGHELGSHANGHFTGADWNADDWRLELSQFKAITEHTDAIDGLPAEPALRSRLNLPPEGIIGFRAPELGSSPDMWPVLKEFGYRYDTSKSGKRDAWPLKDSTGLWQFPLARIYYNTSTNLILSMDYNFYFKQTAAKDTLKKGTPEWDRYYNETLTSFNRYFDDNYNGSRAPVQIGNHFSSWNDSLYWETMKAFAERVCGLPDVKCVTMKEMMTELEQPIP